MSTPRSAESPLGASEQHYEAVLHSPPDDVNAVHDLLSRVWARNPHVAALERFRFETALVELTGNIFEHADVGQGLECTVEVTVTPERISAAVTDSGVPLDGGIGATEMPDELAESGRGLPLIHALVDEVTYARAHPWNHWALARELRAADSPLHPA